MPIFGFLSSHQEYGGVTSPRSSSSSRSIQKWQNGIHKNCNRKIAAAVAAAAKIISAAKIASASKIVIAKTAAVTEALSSSSNRNIKQQQQQQQSSRAAASQKWQNDKKDSDFQIF